MHQQCASPNRILRPTHPWVKGTSTFAIYAMWSLGMKVTTTLKQLLAGINISFFDKISILTKRYVDMVLVFV